MDDTLPTLSAPEVRVLGALIEKQLTTPEYYPLSLNALTNACNQLTNRDPVVAYDEQTVVRACDGLREKRLATLFHGAESRVAKYRHNLADVLPLAPSEVALLCVLLLRGPQTLGELRSRSERLHGFENLADVEGTLNGLIERQPPLVVKLPRAPGTKESRFAHLLSGPPEASVSERVMSPEPAPTPAPAPASPPIQEEVAALRRELNELKEQFAAFRRQFE